MVVPTYETTAKEQEMIINELRSINRTQENRINIQNEEIERLNNIINKIREELEAYIRLCIDVNANDILDMLEHYIKGDK